MTGAKEKTRLKASLIGQRLVESGLLSEDELSEALSIQSNTGLLLGEVCLLKGWIAYAELKDCLPALRSRLGERLLAMGYITIEQLWLALLEQRHTGEKLGEILVSRGWIDKATLDSICSA